MDKRISYAKKHETLINELVQASEGSGPFESKAKCLIYAASVGASIGRDKGRTPLEGKKAEPIRYDVFAGQDFEDFISALAVFATEGIDILGNNEQSASQRVTIFEEFAHGGLERLSVELKGEPDKTDGIVLQLNRSFSDRVGEAGISWDKIEAL